MSFLSDLFWPLPPSLSYSSHKVQALLWMCAVLVLLSFLVRSWRHRTQNPMTKRLSRSWSAALLGFGITGFVLVIARTEGIQFLAMRFLWVVWGLAALAYVLIQIRLFTARHYQVLPREVVMDPREKYLPGKRRK